MPLLFATFCPCPHTGADINGVFILIVKRIFGDHHAAFVHVNSDLDQRRHINAFLIDIIAHARLVSLEFPKRTPNFFHRLDQLIVRFDIRNARIKTGARKIWQVFRIRRASHKNAARAELRFPFLNYLRLQFFVKFPFWIVLRSSSNSAGGRADYEQNRIVDKLRDDCNRCRCLL